MSVLVTGGAGYIGSHMVWTLVDRGEDVVVVDNLTTGSRALVAEKARFVEGNAGDGALVRKLIADHGVDAVIHFAGSIVVPESVANPLAYYANNTIVARNLLEACVEGGVRNFIFSSTASVYGEVSIDPVAEDFDARPINPYGRSKLMTEWMLEDTAHAHDLRYVALRYFNVAGADAKGRTGQSTPRATHLIKRACQVALGRVAKLSVFGTDYPTPDGTGVRDYIHVSDLVAAHALALDHLRGGGTAATFNCGYGRGVSVRQVIDAVERVTGQKLTVTEEPRRPGDPPSIVADSTRIRQTLGWTPQHDDLDEIVRSAHAWESKLNSAG
jgi:UDP-glucose 4-epimerase